MLALINDDKRPWAAHPATWAPFVVVGAGSDLAVAGLPAAAKKAGKARAKDDWTSKVFGQQ
jgi:hypothetical protein